MALTPPPAYGVTGGTYWPTSGTVPPVYPTSIYTLTEIVPGGRYLLQTNPVGGDLEPGAAAQKIFPGTWIYIPSLTGRRLYRVSFVSRNLDGDTPPGTQCYLEFNTGNPTNLPNNVATDIYVVQGGVGIPCTVHNTGGTATCTIDGAPVVVNQFPIKMKWPFEYVATGVGDQLAFTLLSGY